MKSIELFIAELQKLDIILRLENGSLRYNAPEGVMTPDLRSKIVARKAELIALLNYAFEDDLQSTQLVAVPREGFLPLSYAQERLWFLAQLEGPSNTYNIFRAIQIHRDFDLQALKRALNEMVQRHEI